MVGLCCHPLPRRKVKAEGAVHVPQTSRGMVPCPSKCFILVRTGVDVTEVDWVDPGQGRCFFFLSSRLAFFAASYSLKIASRSSLFFWRLSSTIFCMRSFSASYL